MKKKKIRFCVFLCSLVILAVSGCGQREQEPEEVVVVQPREETISYSFATAELSDVVKTAKFKCTYRQTQGQTVSFSLDGKQIEKVYVAEGDKVTRGQLLCELSVKKLTRQIEDLEYRIARNELLMEFADSDENLDISGIWVDYLYNSRQSEQDEERRDSRIRSVQQTYRYKREDYSDSLELLRAQLEEVQAELAASRVYAGTDGIVYQLKENLEGTFSEKDAAIMTILDTAETIFEAKLTDTAQYFQEGDIVPLTIKSGAAVAEYEIMPWKLEEWDDKMYFKLVNASDAGSISVGASGTVSMEVEHRENVLNIPLKALKTADDRTYVYVLGKDNMREVRWVETGLYGDSSVEILSGLDEGEKVILK